jgi:hypothetical protein
MHRRSAILFLLLLTGCAGGLSASALPTPAPIEGPIREQAEEFRRLRTVEGHFSGGDWNDDVDRWMGNKHALMVELGHQLGGGAYSRSQVVELLGEPDAIAVEGEALYDRIRNRGEFVAPPGDGYVFLVYRWRGEHDFLYLVAREETILGAGWWYAGE